MSAPALAGVGCPTLQIRGRPYPVLLPTLRDSRLHLAAVIVTLQVLGQVAFDFDLSIAQILVAVLTAAVLEVAIAFRRQRVILWPASALLTGNGVAFILRVPGTEHGDWWSMHGAWIFAATAAVSLLSKYLIRFRGRHVFNPSNFGLVLCFLALGATRAEPLDFWWGPMTPWLGLALAIIVTGGLLILRRLRLLALAVGFWLVFAAGIGVLAASGHEMTARWHLGPITGAYFWWILVFSPEILVFLFFMITDPKTVPEGKRARVVFGVSVALLATLLIAPQRTEYATKVAVLGALAAVCGARPLIALLSSRTGIGARTNRLLVGRGTVRRVALSASALLGAVAFAGALILAGLPARSRAEATSAPVRNVDTLPPVVVVPSPGVASQISRSTALLIARDVVRDLRIEADALRRRDLDRATAGADGTWLAGLWTRIRAAGDRPIVVPAYDVERMRLTLEPGAGQAQPRILATLVGTVVLETYAGSPPELERTGRPARFERTVQVERLRGRYRIVASRGGPVVPGSATRATPANGTLGKVRLTDVSAQVGLDFRQGAFRFGMSNDVTAMMGGGLCWLDYDEDGWLDLFVVNSYSDADFATWEERGGLPRSALFHNLRGRFEDVSRGSGADLQLRGNGCVAADFDGDGHTDLFVTTAGYNVATDGYDALLWNNGDGTFTEGARAAGINTAGWHAGATAGDVNGDGLPDLFVAGYTQPNTLIPDSDAGFPSNHVGIRDRLYLNMGPGRTGRPMFREVGRQVGLERREVDHGLGAVMTDVDGDGRLDLYVANDLDPNRLYMNARAGGVPGIGFRFQESAAREGVADPNAGMGIAAADYSADGRADLFVTNSRGQLHAVYRTQPEGRAFADARPAFAAALGTRFTGWGVSFADLDLDGDLDLVLANGAIPVRNLAHDAQRVRVLTQAPGGFADATGLVGLGDGPRVNGRGLAAADYDNDGDLDVAINTVGGRLLLLRNTGATGHWLLVKLGRFAPGTVVTAVLPDGRRIVRELQAGSSYLSSEDPRLHFGLGEATNVRELTVRSPDGRVTRLTDVASDQIVAVEP